MVQIQPADLILLRVGPGSTILDRAIGICQQWIGEAPPFTQEFCHAAIIGPVWTEALASQYPNLTIDIGANTIIEARWPKVKIGQLDLPDLLTRNPVDFYRINGITPAQASKIIEYAQDDIGDWYDLAGIFTLGYIQLGHALVCSQYVWKWALNGAGIELCPYSALISPDDLAGSKITTHLTI